ncbi:hypothetical protein BD311DRAFT_839477, partial [Dichomitus squalens]
MCSAGSDPSLTQVRPLGVRPWVKPRRHQRRSFRAREPPGRPAVRHSSSGSPSAATNPPS